MKSETGEAKIPVLIGVTGHRNINTDCWADVRDIVIGELKEIIKHYPFCDFKMLNSLASGADLLCAQAAKECRIPLIAVLPLEEDDYINDFDETDAAMHKEFLLSAEKVIVCEKGKDRDACYRNAGLYVADHSHILFALWDGKPGTETGCGTADIVHYVQNNQIMHVINHIQVPRAGETAEIRATLLESEKGALDNILKPTNEFDKSSVLDDAYKSADMLSRVYQRCYLKLIRVLAILGVALVLAFLLYDEVNLAICLPIYVIILVAAFIILGISRQKRYHEKYMNFRLFAEALRVQKVLDSAEIKENAASYFTWTQANDTAWIKKAIDAFEVCNATLPETDGKDWIDEQYEYHRKAIVVNEYNIKKNNRISGIITVVTLFITIAALYGVLFVKGVMQAGFAGLTVNNYFLIAIGVLSALSLFLSSYYGKLSLERKLSDHKDMMRLYDWAKKLIEKNGLTAETIKKIAGEEIIEAGNWYSYTKENKLDINI